MLGTRLSSTSVVASRCCLCGLGHPSFILELAAVRSGYHLTYFYNFIINNLFSCERSGIAIGYWRELEPRGLKVNIEKDISKRVPSSFSSWLTIR